MPKTTVWHHVHNIVIPIDKKIALLSRTGGSHIRKIQREFNAEVRARELLHSNQRELLIAVSMLYWAEGHKKSFVFTNTDPKMLQLYIKFLTSVLNVSESDIMILVRIADPIDSKYALQYWSQALELPYTAFKINHNNIQNRTKTEFGICRIMVTKSEFLHKLIVSLRKQIYDDLMPS